jgi:hypothetical protein
MGRRGSKPKLTSKQSNPVFQCMGCGEPSVTAFCNQCAPPDPARSRHTDHPISTFAFSGMDSGISRVSMFRHRNINRPGDSS